MTETEVPRIEVDGVPLEGVYGATLIPAEPQSGKGKLMVRFRSGVGTQDFWVMMSKDWEWYETRRVSVSCSEGEFSMDVLRPDVTTVTPTPAGGEIAAFFPIFSTVEETLNSQASDAAVGAPLCAEEKDPAAVTFAGRVLPGAAVVGSSGDWADVALPGDCPRILAEADPGTGLPLEWPGGTIVCAVERVRWLPSGAWRFFRRGSSKEPAPILTAPAAVLPSSLQESDFAPVKGGNSNDEWPPYMFFEQGGNRVVAGSHVAGVRVVKKNRLLVAVARQMGFGVMFRQDVVVVWGMTFRNGDKTSWAVTRGVSRIDRPGKLPLTIYELEGPIPTFVQEAWQEKKLAKLTVNLTKPQASSVGEQAVESPTASVFGEQAVRFLCEEANSKNHRRVILVKYIGGFGDFGSVVRPGCVLMEMFQGLGEPFSARFLCLHCPGEPPFEVPVSKILSVDPTPTFLSLAWVAPFDDGSSVRWDKATGGVYHLSWLLWGMTRRPERPRIGLRLPKEDLEVWLVNLGAVPLPMTSALYADFCQWGKAAEIGSTRRVWLSEIASLHAYGPGVDWSASVESVGAPRFPRNALPDSLAAPGTRRFSKDG